MPDSSDNNDLTKSLYGEIATLLTAAQAQVRTAVNTAMVQTYWQIGRLIVEEESRGQERADYGDFLLRQLAKKLTADFGKGFGRTNLNYFRQFYLSFPIVHSVSGRFSPDEIKDSAMGHAVSDLFSDQGSIVHAVSGESADAQKQPPLSANSPALRPELSWTHYRHLLKVKDQTARDWYMHEAANENWATRALERQINALHYERLLSSQEKGPVSEEAAEKIKALQPQDILRDPYVLEFLQLRERPSYSERDLETALIDQLQDFLLELGKGFSFVSRQKRISLDGEHFFIDLVFYNYLLKCFVLIDLKIGKLTHQDIGQLDSYVRIYEDQYRGEGDNPTIGLILCSEKNEAVARYSVLSDHETLFASKYQMILPSEEELARELEKEIAALEGGRE
jgi:predicted nuclease of restriction endonuclease-like (RecB) superfamily/predicted GNAT family N-acyltransferase